MIFHEEAAPIILQFPAFTRYANTDRVIPGHSEDPKEAALLFPPLQAFRKLPWIHRGPGAGRNGKRQRSPCNILEKTVFQERHFPSRANSDI
jgi:hypothetical protein